VGIGTVAFALLIGPLAGIFIPRLTVPEPKPRPVEVVAVG
jgi:hypothetical protein